MTTVPLAEARANLSGLVESAMTTHERVEITRNGHRAAVLLGVADYDSLVASLEVLTDPELVAGLRSSLAELGDGGGCSLESVVDEMLRAGRLPS